MTLFLLTVPSVAVSLWLSVPLLQGSATVSRSHARNAAQLSGCIFVPGLAALQGSVLIPWVNFLSSCSLLMWFLGDPNENVQEVVCDLLTVPSLTAAYWEKCLTLAGA